MLFTRTSLKDAWIIDVERRADSRGYFARTMCRQEFAAHGIHCGFEQENLSVSFRKGTIRGMHFQLAPHTEAKLVRCVHGSIVDVIVDVRKKSPTFLRHAKFELSAQTHRMLYVPEGFAHAFQTLTDDVEVNYLVSAAYSPEAERGLRFDDPLLGIDWPLPVSEISPKDAAWPLLLEGQDPMVDALPLEPN